MLIIVSCTATMYCYCATTTHQGGVHAADSCAHDDSTGPVPLRVRNRHVLEKNKPMLFKFAALASNSGVLKQPSMIFRQVGAVRKLAPCPKIVNT